MREGAEDKDDINQKTRKRSCPWQYPLGGELRFRRRPGRALHRFPEGLRHALQILPQPGHLGGAGRGLADAGGSAEQGPALQELLEKERRYYRQRWRGAASD